MNDLGIEQAPLVAWWVTQPTYRYHNPDSISMLADQVHGDIPFSLDFYITPSSASSNALDQYEKYFIQDKDNAEWFVLRKIFQSTSIAAAFEEKIRNMDEIIIHTVNIINDIFYGKCENKFGPKEEL